MTTSPARLKELLECEKPLSKRWRVQNAHKYDTYVADGGYEGLKIAKAKKPEEIIAQMKEANTRGRGGAGFPTGMKWGFLPPTRTETFLVINADESEPGTFKDRYIMERDPHLLLEGIAIASYAIKAQVCYVFIRGEFGLAIERMNHAIEEATAKGVFKDLHGPGSDLKVFTHSGAGAYICGEETALLESLEGKRGYPRLKPPFPAVKGAFAKPTIVNNVETIVLAPVLMTKGVEWFAKNGVDKCGGTKLYCVSGAVAKPGTYELPHHVTLRELVFDVAGGMLPGRKLKGIIPGGSSVPILTDTPAPQLLPPLKEGEVRDPKTPIPTEIDVRLDFESVRKVNSFLGSCGIIVVDDKTCIVRALLNLMQFYHHESCGQCTPCREGTGWLERMLLRVERGDGTLEDLDTIYSAGKNIMGNTICALGDAAAMPTISYFEKFKDEFVAHVRDHKCPHPEDEEIIPSGWVL